MARILIADDDPEYLAAFCDGLKVLGHEVVGLREGRDVVPSLQSQPFDIIFLDVIMEGGGAITLVHQVRSVDQKIPIVIITGKVEILESPIMQEGLRMAQAKVRKTATLVELERLVLQLTSRLQ